MSATGQATGMMAELLGRLGINTDEWNKGLAEAQKNGDGLNYIMDTLANTGLSEVNEKWKENNKGLIDYYLEFGSFLDKKHGDFSVKNGEKLEFKLGNKVFILEDKDQPHLKSLTTILYEIFYKHQF